MKTRGFFLLILILFLSTAAVSIAQDNVETKYVATREAYLDFVKKAKPAQKQRRDQWMKHINAFAAIQKKYPKHNRADDCLYWIGDAWKNIHQVSRVKGDLRSAVQAYKKLIDLYPGSNLADDAAFFMGELYEKLGQPREAWKSYAECCTFSNADMAREAVAAKLRLAKYAPAPTPAPTPEPAPEPFPEAALDPAPEELPAPTPAPAGEGGFPLETLGKAVLSNIDVWSNPDYTRIVVYLDREAAYEPHLLPADPDHNMPRRLYLDFPGTVFDPKLSQNIPIGDGLLKQVRVGQFSEDTARVVLDIQSIRTHRIFPMVDPYRVIIDVTGTAAAAPAPKPQVRTIVIDAGHGGKDPGACVGKYKEKNLTLTLARKTAARLKSMGFAVVMTRDSDHYIPLEGRTALANKVGADLFVSIHINASRKTSPSGIETFHFAPKASTEDLELVAAENKTAAAQVAQMDRILQGIELGYKKLESNALAANVQNDILDNLSPYRGTVSRGVKSAPFYVLMGANMPAILVECGFITNAGERKRLYYAPYQDRLAAGIAQGIADYARELDSDLQPNP